MRYEVRYRSHGQEWGQWRDAIPSGAIEQQLDTRLFDVARVTLHSPIGLRWQWRIARG